MGKPLQQDLLAYQLSQAQHHPSTYTPPAPVKKMSLQPRTAIARRGLAEEESDEQNEDDKLYGIVRKSKPKESLMDLLNSDPPWANLPEPAPPAAATTPKKKSSFGNRLLRTKTNPSPANSQPAITPEEDFAFRKPGSLRTTTSASSLRGNGSKRGRNKMFDDDEFAHSLPPITKKLSAKGAQGMSSSTRDLADFLRSSEPPSGFYGGNTPSMRSRAPSVTGSIETTHTTTSQIKNVLSRPTNNGNAPTPPRSPADDRLPTTPLRHDSKGWNNNVAASPWAASRGEPENQFYETVSPAAAMARVHSSSPPMMVNTTNLMRNNSLTNTSPNGTRRTSPRKPAPTPSPELLEEEEALASDPNRMSSMPYISESTLAMILGEDSPPESHNPRATPRVSSPIPNGRSPQISRPIQVARVQPQSQTTPAAVAERKEIVAEHLRSHSRADGSIVSATNALRDSTTQTTPPPGVVSATPTPIDDNKPPPFKFTRRPATAESTNGTTTPPPKSSARPPFNAQPSLSAPSRSRRPTSPPPDVPLPLPPSTTTTRRVRPVSIATQPTVRESSGSFHSISSAFARRVSEESLLDPPLTGGMVDGNEASGSDNDDARAFEGDDLIFVALRALQASMKSASRIQIDPRAFKVAPVEDAKSAASRNFMVPGQGVGGNESDSDLADEKVSVEEGQGLKSGEIKALLPVLKALQAQMSNAASLLELVIGRATSYESAEVRDKTSKTVDALLNGDSSACDSGVALSDESGREKEDEEEDVQEVEALVEKRNGFVGVVR